MIIHYCRSVYHRIISFLCCSIYHVIVLYRIVINDDENMRGFDFVVENCIFRKSVIPLIISVFIIVDIFFLFRINFNNCQVKYYQRFELFVSVNKKRFCGILQLDKHQLQYFLNLENF